MSAVKFGRMFRLLGWLSRHCARSLNTAIVYAELHIVNTVSLRHMKLRMGLGICIYSLIVWLSVRDQQFRTGRCEVGCGLGAMRASDGYDHATMRPLRPDALMATRWWPILRASDRKLRSCRASRTARSTPTQASIGRPSPVLSSAINPSRPSQTDGRLVKSPGDRARLQMNSSWSTEQSNCVSTVDDDANFSVAQVRRPAVDDHQGCCTVNQANVLRRNEHALQGKIKKVCS